MTSSPPLLEPRPDLVEEDESDLLTWPERERLALRLFDAALVELVRRLTEEPEAAKGTTFGEVSKLLATYHKEVEPKRPPDLGDFLRDLPFSEEDSSAPAAPAPVDTSAMELPFDANDVEQAHLEDLQRKVEEHERVAQRENSRFVGRVEDTTR